MAKRIGCTARRTVSCSSSEFTCSWAAHASVSLLALAICSSLCARLRAWAAHASVSLVALAGMQQLVRTVASIWINQKDGAAMHVQRELRSPVAGELHSPAAVEIAAAASRGRHYEKFTLQRIHGVARTYSCEDGSRSVQGRHNKQSLVHKAHGVARTCSGKDGSRRVQGRPGGSAGEDRVLQQGSTRVNAL
eukprot:1140874-Pelagomonas_calceolata.AAC.1